VSQDTEVIVECQDQWGRKYGAEVIWDEDSKKIIEEKNLKILDRREVRK